MAEYEFTSILLGLFMLRTLFVMIKFVGTINLDYRSLYLHFECGFICMMFQQLKILKGIAFKNDRRSCKREMTPEDVVKGRFRGC